MEYKWELHIAEPTTHSRDRIRVTINPKGGFYLNPVALKALGEPEAVQLMYDRKQSVIGIVRTPIDKKGSYRLKRKVAGKYVGGQYFYATSFCNKFRINPKEVTLFIDPRVNGDGILILDLNEVMSARKRKPEPSQ